jgi:hypothetical protein
MFHRRLVCLRYPVSPYYPLQSGCHADYMTYRWAVSRLNTLSVLPTPTSLPAFNLQLYNTGKPAQSKHTKRPSFMAQTDHLLWHIYGTIVPLVIRNITNWIKIVHIRLYERRVCTPKRFTQFPNSTIGNKKSPLVKMGFSLKNFSEVSYRVSV